MIQLTEQVWSYEEIERGLRQFPALIAKKSQELAEKEAEVKQMEHAIKLIEAGVTLEVTEEKRTATEQKAAGYIASATQRKELIHLEKEQQLLIVEVHKYSNAFDSIRKAANLMIEERKRL